jgi:hypothetical protein
MVYTRVHVPDACGEPFNAGALVFDFSGFRQLRTSWLIVGKPESPCVRVRTSLSRPRQIYRLGQTTAEKSST